MGGREAEDPLVQSIYRTVGEPEHWFELLAALRRAVGVKHATVCSPSVVGGTPFALDAYDDTLEVERTKAFVAEFGDSDPISGPMAAGLAGRWDQLITASQVMDWSEIRTNRPWWEHFQRLGVVDVAALVLHEPDGPWPILSVAADDRSNGFSPEQLGRLSELAAHLRLAARLRYRLGPELGLQPHYLAALDGMASGCILLDEHRRILHQNPAAALHFVPKGPLCDRLGQLQAVDAAVDARLQPVLRQACGLGSRSGGEVLLERREASPLMAMVTPLGGDSPLTERLSFARAAVYLVAAAAQPESILAERRLQRLLGLTTAEAQIAYDLILGDSPEEMATRRRRSIHTVRAQVRAVLGKLGFHRTAQLQSLASLLRPPFGEER